MSETLAVDVHREQFVEALVRTGDIQSESVKEAFSNVPRHRFVSRWYGFGVSAGVPRWVETQADPLSPNERHLESIYSTRSLVTSVDGLNPTGALSAPPLVAQMLETLSTDRGMRILEIGTGSGYNAALLGALVGNSGAVHTLETRAEAADEAAETLTALGYRWIAVHVQDGFHGFPPSAPYDRIIATAGCSDLSPHWISQLEPGGQMLVPMQYGYQDFLVLAKREPGRENSARGRIVGACHFMPMGGVLDWANPWRTWTTVDGRDDEIEEHPLPECLRHDANALHPLRSDVHKSFYFYLCQATRELWYSNQGYGIADLMSGAKAGVLGDRLMTSGRTGTQTARARLLDRFREVCDQWADLDRPKLEDYHLAFVPKDRFHQPLDTPTTARRVIERVAHLELISL